jgi:peptide/nickel transport system permease protein
VSVPEPGLAGPAAADVVELPAETVQPGALRTALGKVARRPGAILALVWLVVVGGASVFAPYVSPYDPLLQDLSSSFAPPSHHHLLGADQLGRDVLSRLIYGGRGILLGCFETVIIAIALGVPLGLVAGYVGRWLDTALAFWVNVLFSIPGFVLLIAIAFITGNNLWAIMAALGVLASATILRLVRASAQSLRSRLFVDYARISGVTVPRILMRHILTNALAPLIVQVFYLFSIAFVISASLSFLSLGFNPETPSWGQMLFDATQNIYLHPWLMVPVGFVLAATVLSLQSLGTAFRTALPHADPRSVLADRRGRITAAAAATPAPTPRPAAVDDVLLEVEQLTVSFPRRDGDGRYSVVDGIDLTIRRGETLGIVGESGSGKTMTALALLGLGPHPGAVTVAGDPFDGRDILSLSDTDQERLRGRDIGYISQEPMIALDPCFTIASTLTEPLRTIRGLSRKAARTEALELLRLVGISRPAVVADSYPHQLSGGMAQRVAIALALASRPKLLIADEPTTALDVTIQAEILDLLRTLQAETGRTMILVTHDLGVVADMCSRVAVMYAAQIVEAGDAVDILRNPTHPYTLSLMSAVPTLADRDRRIRAVEGTVPLPHEWPVGCRFADRCPVAVDACRTHPVQIEFDGARARRCIRDPALVRAALEVDDVAESGT